MRIVQAPADILIGKAEAVIQFDLKLSKLVERMIKTLKSANDPEGVGLAAPQVAIAKRLFVMNTSPENEAAGKYEAFINPKIIDMAKTKAGKILEGCLSINNVWGYPERSNSIKLSYQDVKGQKLTRKFTRFSAIIVQHEVDHLQGVLFTHKVMQEGKNLYKIDKDEKGEVELTSLEL